MVHELHKKVRFMNNSNHARWERISEDHSVEIDGIIALKILL